MGAILSRFRRKKPTTLEQLIKIEESLKKIEDYRKSTEQKQKRTVANILIYGAALYVLACVIVFVWYLPESWLVRLGLLIPFILIPFIIYGMKRCISGYFNSKMIKANKEYEDLQQKKKEIIDNIMETETFNKAKEILTKYAPEKLGRREFAPMPVPQSKAMAGPIVARPPISDPSVLRRRLVENTNTQSTLERSVGTHMLAIQQARSIPKPMFSRNRGFTDKLIEYIVGDGPSYRFALICRHCNGHNGMALQEEFPYVAYNCCYCLKFNPARSQRPLAPPLADSNGTQLSLPGISEADHDEQNSEEEISKLGETSSQEPPATEKNEALEGELDQAEEGACDNLEDKDLETSSKSDVDINEESDDIPSRIDKPDASEDDQAPEPTQENTAKPLEDTKNVPSN